MTHDVLHWSCPNCERDNVEYYPLPVNVECEQCGDAYALGWLYLSTMTLHTYNTLITVISLYDSTCSDGGTYNPYALAQYLARLDEVRADMIAGRPPRAAIIAGYRGRLQTMLLRAIGEPPATAKERHRNYTYAPYKPCQI